LKLTIKKEPFYICSVDSFHVVWAKRYGTFKRIKNIFTNTTNEFFVRGSREGRVSRVDFCSLDTTPQEDKRVPFQSSV